MKTKILLKARWLLCGLLAVFLTTNVWADEVTYTVSNASTVTTEGTAPTGSSATLTGSGTLNSGWIQCTSTNSSKTLTLTGFEGHKITAITIHVKSNASKGAGSFSVVAGSTTIASIASGAFNTANWNGSWNSTGVDKVLTMTDGNYEIGENESVTLSLNVTTNSIYIKSYKITYEAVGGSTPAATLSSIEVTGDLSDKTYENTDRIDLTGLVVTGTYSDASTNNVTADATWEVRTDGTSESFTPSTYELTAGQTSVQVRATVDDKQSDWVIINDLTVTAHVATPGTYNITLANAFWGTNGTGAGAGHTASGTQDDITISIAGNSGTQNYINDAQTRVYGSHTITFSVPAGYVLTQITGLGTPSNSSISVASGSTGSISERVWTGSAQTVTFSVTGRTDFTTVSVTFDVPGAELVSIAVGGDLNQKTYEETDHIDLTGLTVTGTYDDSSEEPITSGITWQVRTNGESEVSASEDYTMTLGQTSVQVQATVNELTSAWFTVSGLTVNAHVPTAGTYNVLLNNAFWGSDLTTSLTGANLKDYSGTQDDLTFDYKKGTGSNMYFNASQTRVYNGNQLVVTAPDGFKLTSITGLPSSIAANVGEISGTSWTGASQEVIFTRNASSGYSAFTTISVTYAALVASAVTYNATPDHGMVSIEKDDIELASGTTVNEGDVLDVILAGDDGYVGTVAVTATESGEDITTEVYNAETGKLTMPAYPITVTATFVVGVETPVFDLADGIYADAQLVLLSTSTTGASIYYTMTTDGTTPADPTNASTLYNAEDGIELTARGTYKIKAIAYKNENYSSIAAAEYTLNIPYVFATVTEMVSYLEANSLTELDNVVVTGVVSKIVTAYSSQHGNVTFDISDDGQTTGNQMRGYRTTGTNADVVAVGDKVTLSGDYTLYNDVNNNTLIPELKVGNTITAYTAKVLSSVTVGGTASKTVYFANETFEFIGLTATAHYSNTGYSALIDNAEITWATNLSENKVTESTTVQVTATYNDMTSATYNVAITVSSKALVSIALGSDAYTVYKGAALPKPAVTATYTEGEPADVSAEAVYDTESAYDAATAGGYTITVSYTFGTTTKTATYQVTVNEYANAENAPYTVTEALAIITSAIGNTESADAIVVTGTVSDEKIGNSYGRYKITDGTNKLLVFGGKGFNEANFTADNYPKVGDVVVVKGNVINYNNETPEFASGKSYLLSQVRPAWLSIEDVAQLEVGAEDMALADLTITTESTGDITYVSEDETKLTIEEDKLHAVAPGTVTVTANMAATNNVNALNYAATSTTFQVTVVGTLPRYAVTFAANGGEGNAPVVENQLAGATFNLPANTFTYTGFQFAGWNDGTTTYGAGAEYTMPAQAVTFTAQWNAVCPWASVYTSNVVIGGVGTSEANSKVEIADTEYEAKKVGSGSNTGSVTVTVPAGTHTLHFHAAAWNSASSMTIAASGVNNMSVSSFAIAADAGVKATDTYTLAGDPIDQHFHFTFDAVADETVITFSKASGTDNRFVMYGINQEGGPELQSITIGGNATNTEYVYGQTFDPAGLTVSAVYRVSGVDQDPVDVTDRVVWTFDPAAFNSTSQTTVTATATFETKSASKTVNVTVSEPATPNVTYTAIVVKKGDKYYAMGQTLSSGALNAVELEDVVNGKMVNVPVEDRTALTWIITETEDGATFQAQNGKYLSGNGSNTTLSWSTEPVVWAWNDTYGCYAIGGRSFYMYNSTTQFKNFALSNMNNTPSQCSSKPENLSEYIDIDNTKEIVTLRSGLENGKIGTMCWNADIYEVEGAYFFEPEMKQADGVCFAEAAKEGGVYPAGKPYVFQATGEEIRAVVSKTTTDVAGTNNGLHGTFERINVPNGEGYYIIYQNKLYTANNNYIEANRAYINKSQLPGASSNPAPGRRRLVIGRDNLPTGIDAVVLDGEQVQKVLIDGQIYIVRDGKMYDLTGRMIR